MKIPAHIRNLTWLVLACTVFAGGALASARAGELDSDTASIRIDAYTSLTSAPAGGEIQLALVLRLAPPWHVNAHVTNEDYLIPTRVEFSLPEGLGVAGMVYPEPVEKNLGFSEQPLLLYEGEAAIGAVITVAAGVPPGEVTVTATVTFQACDNRQCVAPEQRQLSIPLRISAPTEAIDLAHAEVFAQIDFPLVAPGEALADDAPEGETRLGAVVSQRGYLVAFVVVFLWGLALNLTPCVYPIIPITVSYFGGQSSGRAGRTFVLASFYVLGMATTYSALGLFAALTGSLLGTALQNPLVVILVAAVLAGLAFSMFGFYEFRLPGRLTNLAGRSTTRQGAVGAFLTGLTVGIVAAPCIGPFVLALLTFVGQSGNPLLGFSLFFTLALGLGLPFLFLAMLSGNISRLPKSGEWMEWIKKLFGLILLAMAVFFLEPLLSDPVYFLLMGAVFLVGGIIVGFVLKVHSASVAFRAFRRLVGLAAPLLGLYLVFAPGHVWGPAEAEEGVLWEMYSPELLATAQAESRYVLIDFYADWCLPCKELDHRTFSRPEVASATADYVRLKANLTDSRSQEVAALRKQYGIRGVPTIIFIDGSGREHEDLRVLGFVDSGEFLRRLGRLKDDS